ncbi:CLUMA_CG007146, isoform A [Clunio marinus]|uniref:CLUMA_CG007146, isoform A n=1 Tax=Clunio marinus TaxID=568069 RepID=A0A1J1HZT7_9DIPT|nr:CLUMA_CG007146, isoform A [Clunio marinus]
MENSLYVSMLLMLIMIKNNFIDLNNINDGRNISRLCHKGFDVMNRKVGLFPTCQLLINQKYYGFCELIRWTS